MTIESALLSHLNTEFAADSNLSGITIAVHPHIVPQGSALPYIVYSIISTVIDDNLSDAARTLTESYFDLSVFSESVSERALIITSIKDILHGFSGALGSESLNIRKIVVSNVSTFGEADLTGTDRQIYRASVSVIITSNWS